MNNDRLLTTNGSSTVQNTYDDIIKYVINNKKNDVTVLELLCEYAFKNDLEYELVGDAVMDDECIKNVIANEVKLNNRIVKVDEW